MILFQTAAGVRSRSGQLGIGFAAATLKSLAWSTSAAVTMRERSLSSLGSVVGNVMRAADRSVIDASIGDPAHELDLAARRASSTGMGHLILDPTQPREVGAPALGASSGCFAMEWGADELSTVCQTGTFRDVLRTPLRLQLCSSPPKQWGGDDVAGGRLGSLQTTLQTSISLEDAFKATLERSGAYSGETDDELAAANAVAAAAKAIRANIDPAEAVSASFARARSVGAGRSATVRAAVWNSSSPLSNHSRGSRVGWCLVTLRFVQTPVVLQMRSGVLSDDGVYADSRVRFDWAERAKGLGSDIRFVSRAGIERLLRSQGKALIHPVELATLRRLYEEFLAHLQSKAPGVGGAVSEKGQRPMSTLLGDLVAVLRASHLDAYPAVARCWCYPSRVALVAARQLMLQIAEDTADLLIAFRSAIVSDRHVKEQLQNLLIEVLSRGELSFQSTSFGRSTQRGNVEEQAAWSAKGHRMRPLSTEARAKKNREEDLAFLLHCRHLTLRAIVVANNAMLSSRFISPRQRKFIANVLAASVIRLPALHVAVFNAMEFDVDEKRARGTAPLPSAGTVSMIELELDAAIAPPVSIISSSSRGAIASIEKKLTVFDGDLIPSSSGLSTGIRMSAKERAQLLRARQRIMAAERTLRATTRSSSMNHSQSTTAARSSLIFSSRSSALPTQSQHHRGHSTIGERHLIDGGGDSSSTGRRASAHFRRLSAGTRAITAGTPAAAALRAPKIPQRPRAARPRADTPGRQHVAAEALAASDWRSIEYELSARFGELALRQQLWETLHAGRVEAEDEDGTETALVEVVTGGEESATAAAPAAIEYIASVITRRGELWASIFQVWSNTIFAMCSFKPMVVERVAGVYRASQRVKSVAVSTVRNLAGRAEIVSAPVFTIGRRENDVDWGSVLGYEVRVFLSRGIACNVWCCGCSSC